MERNSKNYLSIEYYKAIILAIYSFIYMFVYTIFYPVNNRSNTNINSRGGNNYDSYDHRRGGNGGGSFRSMGRRG